MKDQILQAQAQKSLHELRQVSQMLGNDIMLVQGAGGNTSCKIDSTMWVKASGKLLGHAMQEEIFVEIDYAKLCRNLDRSNFDISEYVVGSNINLRPSIEAPLHAIFESPAVIHAHAINSMAALVLQDCKQYIAGKIGGAFDYIIVDYVAPGIELARAIKAGIEKAGSGNAGPIVFMKNHGIVIGADNMGEAYSKLLKIEELLGFAPRDFGEMASKTHHIEDYSEYEFMPNWQGIAFDQYCQKVLSSGPLFPDQAVYLGEKVPVLCCLGEAQNEPLVIIENNGVFRRKNCDISTTSIIEGLLRLCTRIPENANIEFIGPKEVDFLINWEAEKYRKSQT